jgi:hypothetical protein
LALVVLVVRALTPLLKKVLLLLLQLLVRVRKVIQRSVGALLQGQARGRW